MSIFFVVLGCIGFFTGSVHLIANILNLPNAGKAEEMAGGIFTHNPVMGIVVSIFYLVLSGSMLILAVSI